MRKIKYLNVGKSFWIPILISGIFFFTGSIAAILFDLGVVFDYLIEFEVFIRLLALCVLLGGVSTYSKRITKNLAEEFVLPTRPEPFETEDETIEEDQSSESIVDQFGEKKPEEEHICKYKLGYLKSLQKNTPIPEECLSCQKIIQCKHS